MIEGLSTPQRESRRSMIFPKPGSYRIRVLIYAPFYSTWLPLIVSDPITGGFKTIVKHFLMPDEEENKFSRLLFRLGLAEKAAKKELLGDVQEAKESIFMPRRRFRLIGFDLSGSEGSDPNVLSTFEFGPGLEESLYKLAWGTSKKDPRILNYGPLWAYDIYLTRTGTERYTTRWSAEPVEKIGPFEGKLTIDLKSPEKWNEWIRDIDFSQYFNKEQLAIIDGCNVKELLMDSFRFSDDASIITHFLQEPINLSATDQDGKAMFPASIIPLLTQKLEQEAKKLGIYGKIHLLKEPVIENPEITQDSLVQSVEDMEIVEEVDQELLLETLTVGTKKPAGNTAKELDW